MLHQLVRLVHANCSND